MNCVHLASLIAASLVVGLVIGRTFGVIAILLVSFGTIAVSILFYISGLGSIGGLIALVLTTNATLQTGFFLGHLSVARDPQPDEKRLAPVR